MVGNGAVSIRRQPERSLPRLHYLRPCRQYLRHSTVGRTGRQRAGLQVDYQWRRVPTAQAQVTASSDINFAQSEPTVVPGFTGAISSMYDASSKPRRAIWVMPLLWGPPRSGVKPTSVKVWRSVSRFDPQTDTWSSSRTTVLFSWVVTVWGMAGREMSTRTSAAKDMQEQTGELRLGMRASLRKKKKEWHASNGLW